MSALVMHIGAAGAMRTLGPQDAADTILIVPGESVVGHSLHLPAAGEAQTRAAARFAVEDELAADPATVHVAVGLTSGAGAPRLIVVAARTEMESWLRAARSAGAPPDAVLPEWACLPAAAGECAMLVAGGVAHVNCAGAWGFSAETDLAALLLPRALERFDCRRVTVWGDPTNIAPPDRWDGREITAHPALDADAMLALLARGAEDARLNLLQGEYTRRRAFAVDVRQWRRAAILLCAAFGAWLALTLAEAGALDRRAAALRAEAEAAFAETFPDEARIVNPRLQMQTRLEELRGRGGGAFLDLAAMLTAAAEAQESVEIDALRYDRTNAALTAELIMADYEALQALRDIVAAQGGALEEGASRQADGRVAADVTVRLP
jgi:general secretion pathway protein L